MRVAVCQRLPAQQLAGIGIVLNPFAALSGYLSYLSYLSTIPPGEYRWQTKTEMRPSRS